jgi:soluble lytic murein transglycosylase
MLASPLGEESQLCYSPRMHKGVREDSHLVSALGTTIRFLWPGALALSMLFTSCADSVPIPVPFQQPTPTVTALPTATPTSLASPTTTPLPTATPTPILAADEALAQGLSHQRNGDYEAAVGVYQAIVSSYPDSSESRDALYHLGETYALAHDYPAALDSLQEFRQRYPDDERYAFTTFRLAATYDELGYWDEAILLYREYGEQRNVIPEYVRLFVGYDLMELERYEEAREEFAQVLDLAPPLTVEQQALQQTALASRRLEEYEQAITYYQRLLDRAQEDGTRAETLYQMAVTYQERDDVNQAVDVFIDLATKYPRSYRAYQALEELDALEAAGIDGFQRGLIYYYNGLYDPAVLAFYDYIENVEDTAEAHYYAALAYRGYEAHYLNIDELETIIEEFPTSDLVGQAWLEIAKSWILIGNNESAADTYAQFLASRPQDPLADDAAWKRANLLEDDADFEEAIGAYLDLVAVYQSSNYAPQALFRAGLNQYRLAQYDEARQSWQTLLEDYPQSDARPRALFWLGKSSLENGEVENAEGYLQGLLDSDGAGYYGLRAADLLRGGWADNPPDVYSPDLYRMDDEGERLALEEWLATWAGAGGDQEMHGLSPLVASDLLFQKGLELLRVGQWDSAKARFRELRTRFQDDPLALYQLALFFQREGFYDQSIACAQRILKLSPQSSLYDVPRFLQKLHYPVYFADLIVPQAEKRGLEPLLFAALIWQESWYDPFATSGYPARGLTQFIEPTADWAAEELGFTDFQYSDLYRPVVAVEFGGWYLGWILNYEDGQVFRALAHYNAGPGNVARWTRDGEVTDIDLFVEEVDFAQTEAFIHLIYGHYWTYRTAYYAPD